MSLRPTFANTAIPTQTNVVAHRKRGEDGGNSQVAKHKARKKADRGKKRE